MKKLTWIAALLITLALIVTGCPGGGDTVEKPTGGDEAATGVYLASSEGGTGVANNTIITTSVTQLLYLYFEPTGRDFEKLVLDYTINPAGNVTVQALYGYNGAGDPCTWGTSDWNPAWFDGSGSYDIIPSIFTADWSNTGANAINKSTIHGMCINIAEDRTTFKVTGVTFVGLAAAADKTALNELITEAEALIQADYTSESWAPFASALAAAKAVATKSGATVDEVGTAGFALYEAMEELVPAQTVNKTALNNLITQASTLESSNYTSGSWSALEIALNAAKIVSEAGNAIQTQVTAATTALQTAIDGLVVRPPATGGLDDLWTYHEDPVAGVTCVLQEESQYVVFADGKITLTKNPTDGSGAYRVQFNFSPALNVSTARGVLFNGTLDGNWNITYKTQTGKTLNNWGTGAGSWGLWGGMNETSEWGNGAFWGEADQTLVSIELWSDSATGTIEITSFNFSD